MNIEPIHVLIGIALGLGTTLVMDLWCMVLKLAFDIPSPNYCFVGRWLCFMPEGIFRHRSIAAASRKPAECTIGWIGHYSIGVIFALLLVLLATPRWLRDPTLLPAMILGLTTVAIPFFVMQPSFGLNAQRFETKEQMRAALNRYWLAQKQLRAAKSASIESQAPSQLAASSF